MDCLFQNGSVMIFAVTAALLCTIVSAFYYKRKNDHRFLKKIGIVGPEPHWFFGSFHTFAEVPSYLRYQEWTKTFGKIYGYYESCKPVIITTDLDLIKQVFVKKFSSFHCRKLFAIQPHPDAKKSIHMFLARGERWKRLRTIINPTFSAYKMKQMQPIMGKCANTFINEMDKKQDSGKAFDIYRKLQGLTLDVVCECALGMEVHAQGEKTTPLLARCRQVFESSSRPNIIILLAMFIPELKGLWDWLFDIKRKFGDPLEWISDRVGELVKQRREMEETRRVDLIQLMIEAKEVNDNSMLDQSNALAMTSTEDVSEHTALHNGKAENSNGKAHIVKALTTDEIKSQGQLFLIAGYETTSTILAYLVYELSLNVDVQEKLYEEIQSVITNDTPSYDQVSSMPYLDMVLNETLRKYPVASLVTARTSMEDVNINGLYIPKDVTVQVDVWSIHYDPEHWGSDTEKFVPERFSEERKKTRHPMAFLPFGAGPRNCIGMRFAALEIKMSMVTLLRKYKILRCSETEVPIQKREGATIVPKNGVHVNLELRE